MRDGSINKKMKVLVLAGGDSVEREVSLSSAEAVTKGLRGLGHEVTTLDPAKFLSFDEGVVALQTFLDELTLRDPDVVFIALHGGIGENGTIQTVLDIARVKYTGSSPSACALSMSKPLSKHLARSLEISTADWKVCEVNSPTPAGFFAQVSESLGLPVVVKPAEGGSSVGLTVVNNEEEFTNALNLVAESETLALVEQYVKGRELTVSVFDGRAWPVVEIVPKDGIYDYKAKYTSGGSEYFCPADISDDLAERLQEEATKIYSALRCRSLVRVDFMLDDNGQSFFLELNTVPGLTELSLAPMANKAAGMSFEQMLQAMLESALKS